jgi:hypothetical protein
LQFAILKTRNCELLFPTNKYFSAAVKIEPIERRDCLPDIGVGPQTAFSNEIVASSAIVFVFHRRPRTLRDAGLLLKIRVSVLR